MTRERERCNMCAGSTAHMSCDQFFSPIITPDIPRCMLKMLSDVVRSRSHCILCQLSRVSNSIKRYLKGMTKMYTLLQEHCESDNLLARGDPHVVFLFIYMLMFYDDKLHHPMPSAEILSKIRRLCVLKAGYFASTVLFQGLRASTMKSAEWLFGRTDMIWSIALMSLMVYWDYWVLTG